MTKKYVRREVINHSSLTHPHIVKFRECFLTDKYLAIAMEYAAGGDMFKYVSHKCARNTLAGSRVQATMKAGFRVSRLLDMTVFCCVI